jgi:hypothetical protein
LLKDSVPCPIPNYEKDAHRASSSESTLLIACRRSTTIMPPSPLFGRYPDALLHK